MYPQNNNGGDETDTETSNQTTGNHDTEASGGSLENSTDDEDTAARNNGGTTTDEVGKITSDDGSEEGTSRENRSDQRLLPLCDDESGFAVGFDLIGVVREARELVIGIFLSGILLNEVVHSKNTSHPTCIISEEDTAKGGESDDEVSSHGHWGFHTIHIGGASDGDN